MTDQKRIEEIRERWEPLRRRYHLLPLPDHLFLLDALDERDKGVAAQLEIIEGLGRRILKLTAQRNTFQRLANAETTVHRETARERDDARAEVKRLKREHVDCPACDLIPFTTTHDADCIERAEGQEVGD